MTLISTTFIISSILAICISPITAQSPQSPLLASSPTPTPAVNLTNLLSQSGPFNTFLELLIQTNVIQSFQNQADNTEQGITIFAPSDTAFSEIDKSALSNLTKDQVNSLLLYHAFPKFYSLPELSALSNLNPVNTFAGKQYTLNLTDANGLIQVISDWSNSEINGSVYSINPIALYEVNSVLFPKAIFNTAPALTPAPAPVPTLPPQFVNLTNLLTRTGPFQTFLNLLIQTDVIQTFQNQANNANQGITIFAPSDSAFSKIDKSSLANLTKDQVNSLLLYHAFSKFYSFSDLSILSSHNPVTTLAGKQYTLNLTDTNGLIIVISDWSNPEINNNVYSVNPVAIYEVNSVLLPKAIFTTTPVQAPQLVNLTNILTVAGPFHTFLNLLIQTNVIQTFQNQANNTDQGITIFAPSDSAFSKIDKSSLSKLTKDQVNSLLLYHAFPKFYSLPKLSTLSNHNPVTTIAGKQYTLNLTNTDGLIRVISDWSNSEINGSVYSTNPVAIYEVNSVLLPKAIFNTAPTLAPQFVNLTSILTSNGPFHTFLYLLIQTNVIQTFQNQANNTDQGITIFAPSDSAFSKIDKSSLSKLSKDQVNSLLLYHAFPKFYSFSNLSDLGNHSPVTTIAGRQYTLNLTNTNGLIQVISDWSNSEINGSVYSTDPVAIYEVNSVLLPKAIFNTAPTLAPQFVNLTSILSDSGPFHTFLNLLIQTNVIQTFQNQANNTDQGITIFAPSDSAFSKIDKSSLSKLSKDQVNSLLLYHAFPKFYSLSNLSDLGNHSPVTTIAGREYTLNLTDTNGLIRVISDWSNSEINGSVYSTDPVAIYEVNSVLLPKAIFNTAPTLAPQFVNLTSILTSTGPFHTFLNLLIQTNVIQTFQNQANNTDQGITIFAPSDSAFSKIDKSSLSNLSKDQVNSLLLYHAFPKFYSLSDLSNLSNHNPLTTIAGREYTLNLTDTDGLIRVISDWSNPEINSSVYSTNPVALYEVNSVLFPKAIFTTAPTLTPSPTPAPSPAGQQSGNSNSSSSVFTTSTLAYFFTVLLGLMML